MRSLHTPMPWHLPTKCGPVYIMMIMMTVVVVMHLVSGDTVEPLSSSRPIQSSRFLETSRGTGPRSWN